MAKQCQAGHKGCACTMVCCRIPADRAAEIAFDARSGRNWAAEEAADPRSPSGGNGPACICGAGLRTLTAAIALKGVHGIPQGACPRHPGGTVLRASDIKKGR